MQQCSFVMELNEIPTPLTMGVLSRCHQKTYEVDFSDLAEMTECSQNLERYLTVARDSMDMAFKALTSVTVKSRAEGEILQAAARSVAKALTLTAPKP